MVSTNQKNLILIRGLARGHGHWSQNFIIQITKKYSDYNIYFLDLPGSGLLNKIKTPLTVSEFIPFFKSQLANQGFNLQNTNQYNLGMSISLGSMSFIEWSYQEPDFFKELIVMNTSSKNHSSLLQRFSPSAVILIFQFLMNKNFLELEKQILFLTSNKSHKEITQSEDVIKFSQFSLNYSITKLNFFRQLIAASRFSVKDMAPKVKKIIFLLSQNDRLVNSICSQNIFNTWKTNRDFQKTEFSNNLPPVESEQATEIILNTHSWAGHDLSFDDTEWIINHL